MNEDNPNKEWSEDDEIWQLLGKAAPKQASGRFADDVVRAVRLLPEADSVWPRILKFSRWSLVAACVVLAVSIFMDPVKTQSPKPPIAIDNTNSSDPGTPLRVSREVPAIADNKAQWEQIESAAQAELLAAAVEHLEEFSDQDLITMIGF